MTAKLLYTLDFGEIMSMCELPLNVVRARDFLQSVSETPSVETVWSTADQTATVHPM